MSEEEQAAFAAQHPVAAQRHAAAAIYAASEKPEEPGTVMATFGLAVFWLSLIVFIGSFLLPTTVETETSVGSVVNLARLQFQTMVAVAGGIGQIIGILIYGFGKVLHRLYRFQMNFRSFGSQLLKSDEPEA